MHIPLGTLVGFAFLAAFLNAANITALFFAVWAASRTNTVLAWILWAASAFIILPAAYAAGLSSYTWGIFFGLSEFIVLLLVILASVRACNVAGSCCVCSAKKCHKTAEECERNKCHQKKSGCFSSCCNSGCNSGCCDSGCCESGCCENDCDDNKNDSNDGGRRRKPTHNGGARVHYD